VAADNAAGTLTEKVTLQQIADLAAAGGNPFDQSLNSTDAVSFASVSMGNGSSLSQGSFDAGFGGNYGISLNCTVGYELNWQAGHLVCTPDGGVTKSPILCDSAIEFPGATPYPVRIEAVGISFADGSAQTTAGIPAVPFVPINGDVLTWDDSNAVWTAKATQIQQWDETRTYSAGDLVWHVATARIWRSEGGAPGAEPSPESGSWYAITTPADAQSLPTGADTGHVLTFDGSAWAASPPGIPAPPSPADGDVLVWSADDAAWQAQQPSGGGGATYLSGVVTTDILADGLLEQVLYLAPIVGNSTYLVEGLVVYRTMYNQQMRLHLSALDEDGQVFLDHDKATADLANARTTVRRVDQLASEAVEFESSGDAYVDVPIRFRALIQTANISSTSLILRCGDSVDGQPCDILAGSWMAATKIA